MKNRMAFSLVELAIVLVISGILLAGLLSSARTQIQASYVSTTNSNLQIVSNALELYFSKTGHLPCPADLNLPNTNANYGLARVSSTNSAPDVCITNANGLFQYTSGNDVIYMGAVPFKTLGLVNEFMFDGWDNKLTYVVQRAFINSVSTSSGCVSAGNAQDSHTSNIYICPAGQASGSVNTSSVDIEIRDYLAGRMLNNDAVYVLISHGKNGLGAFLRTADGSGPNVDRNPLPDYPAQVNERNNTNCDANSAACSTTLLTQPTFSTTGGPAEADTFDDILLFRTRNQVIYSCNYNHLNVCTNTYGLDLR